MRKKGNGFRFNNLKIYNDLYEILTLQQKAFKSYYVLICFIAKMLNRINLKQ